MTTLAIILGIYAGLSTIAGVLLYRKLREFASVGAKMVVDLEKTRWERDHYREFAEDVIRERDRAMAMYRRFGQTTSVAQQWLLRDLQQAISVANKYLVQDGKRPLQVAPELKEIIDEYPENVERQVPKVEPAKLPDGLTLQSTS
jgi:hypothetical protein